MNRKFRYLGAFLAIFALSGCTTSTLPISSNNSIRQLAVEDNLNGEWSGAIIFSESAGERAQVVQLAIDGSKVTFMEKDGKNGIWKEFMPGLFKISYRTSDAIIQASNSGRDEDGTWVESWVLIVPKNSKKDLQIQWVRFVNNLDLPNTDKRKTFSYNGIGSLKKFPID